MTEPAFLLDANICVYLLGGKADLLRARIEAQEVGRIATSAIAFAEVMVGAVRHGDVGKADALFSVFAILPFEHSAAVAYSRIPFKRGSFDRLIAAHALALDLTLVTNNERDFADIPGLRIENWTRT